MPISDLVNIGCFALCSHLLTSFLQCVQNILTKSRRITSACQFVPIPSCQWRFTLYHLLESKFISFLPHVINLWILWNFWKFVGEFLARSSFTTLCNWIMLHSHHRGRILRSKFAWKEIVQSMNFEIHFTCCGRYAFFMGLATKSHRDVASI